MAAKKRLCDIVFGKRSYLFPAKPRRVPRPEILYRPFRPAVRAKQPEPINPSWGLIICLLLAVANHFHFLECDQPTAHHYVEHRQEFVYFLFAVDDFDHHRQVD